ncbi:hypothetical protein IQ37_09615 [Chryseobacterium piperi]|uniref:DUF1648 domain-containing protein n=1 Tax=Chryseobacterium piperi TaxID=558152 RepID=A0A086BIM0_9FLAO|nr:hypothetical protein [Chryseobacterium piperi]ASW75607.1 hypothetical protein CJF12_15840 [Chryseobacterium piperi]KFF28784.1 hypothetical protein IQ37_09615 [Chryseobacterium piperi]
MISKKIKLLFSIPVIIIIVYTGYLICQYHSIPDNIPIHGYSENTGGSGSKLFLFFPILLNIILLLLIWRIIKRPDKINFSFELKEEDKAKTYAITQMVLVIISIFITVILTVILFSDVVFSDL